LDKLLRVGAEPPRNWVPDRPPPGWNELIWELLRIRDLQGGHDKEGALSLGMAPVFRRALDNGHLNPWALKSQLDQYRANLGANTRTQKRMITGLTDTLSLQNAPLGFKRRRR
jgi:hypothetical protein